MTNKEIVQTLLPTARIESHIGNGAFGKKYYLIRVLGETMYIGSGDTPAQAWKDALDSALDRGKEAIKAQEKLQPKNNE